MGWRSNGGNGMGKRRCPVGLGFVLFHKRCALHSPVFPNRQYGMECTRLRSACQDEAVWLVEKCGCDLLRENGEGVHLCSVQWDPTSVDALILHLRGTCILLLVRWRCSCDTAVVPAQRSLGKSHERVAFEIATCCDDIAQKLQPTAVAADEAAFRNQIRMFI